MSKNSIKSIIMMAVSAIAVFGGVKAYDYSYGKRVNSEDSMLIANVEALSEDGETTGYETRNTADCTYEAHGAPGTQVTIEMHGNSVTLTTDSLGFAYYVVCDGQVKCSGQGSIACIPQNC